MANSLLFLHTDLRTPKMSFLTWVRKHLNFLKSLNLHFVFILGIQTRFQLEKLKILGKRAICVDATHGTQRYHFLLVTVLVVDEFGKGLPVAWFITSNETQEMLTLFFSALKERYSFLDLVFIFKNINFLERGQLIAKYLCPTMRRSITMLGRPCTVRKMANESLKNYFVFGTSFAIGGNSYIRKYPRKTLSWFG